MKLMMFKCGLLWQEGYWCFHYLFIFLGICAPPRENRTANVLQINDFQYLTEAKCK